MLHPYRSKDVEPEIPKIPGIPVEEYFERIGDCHFASLPKVWASWLHWRSPPVGRTWSDRRSHCEIVEIVFSSPYEYLTLEGRLMVFTQHEIPQNRTAPTIYDIPMQCYDNAASIGEMSFPVEPPSKLRLLEQSFVWSALRGLHPSCWLRKTKISGVLMML